MRADYATSDVISKVNSDWINAVLINPELDRADAGEDVAVGDLMLKPDTSGKRTIPLGYEPEQSSANWTKIERLGITVEPVAPSFRRRSVARRVTERLALAVAALAIAWMGFRMAPELRDATDSASLRATNASPDSAAPINTTALQPAWLVPEILYGPAMARSIPVAKSGR